MSDSSKKRGADTSGPAANEAAKPTAAPAVLPASRPVIVDAPNLQAPEIWASELIGLGYDGDSSVVRLTFVSNRTTYALDRTNQLHQVDAARIVMSVPAARRMAQFLAEFLTTAELNRVQQPPDTPLQ